MALPKLLQDRLTLPVIGAPMYMVSAPELVLAQCQSGIVGSFPALNARPAAQLDDWLARISSELEAYCRAHPEKKVAPYAVNQIVHQSNDRLDHDLELCIKYRVPLIITSLRAPADVVPRIHDYGGLVFHDITTLRHAEKALEAGVDGLILVCAGAGGHGGTLSPFALVAEIRRIYQGTIVLSGAISTGAHILAAQAMGADLAYMGTRFIATEESRAVDAYKQMIVDSGASDVIYTPFFTGVHGNYLVGSIVAQGLDPKNLPATDKAAMSYGTNPVRAWRDIWGAGHGVAAISDRPPVAELVERLRREYDEARERLLGLPA